MIKMQKHTLKNGLTVFHFPKSGFSKSYAVIATNYGAAQSIFSTNEGSFETPQGVAHFLEHKLFEQKNGTNALNLFSKTGASPNAFTSQTMTAYHFECTDKFEENLEILLDFVSNPYFTKENVDKEQGIIAQEIKMVEDNPNWVLFVNLFTALYNSHPIKESIIGSVESISKIDSEILYHCHKVFYNPSNMVLCIAGDVDIERALKIAEESFTLLDTKIENIDYKSEIDDVAQLEICSKMEVALPLFMVGFKDNSKNYDKISRQIIGDILSKYLSSKSSRLYNKLYSQNLIDRSFSCDYSMFPEGACFICAGQSKNPELVAEIIKNEISNIIIDPVDFDGIIKSYIGSKVRIIDNFDDLCISQIDAFFSGGNFSDFEKIIKKITPKNIKDFADDISKYSSLSMIKPN